MQFTEITLYRKLLCVLREHGMDMETHEDEDGAIFNVYEVVDGNGEGKEEEELLFIFYSLAALHSYLVNENLMFI